MENIKKILVSPSLIIIDALKLMDEQNCKLLIVMDDNKFLSVLSLGDIQRAIIKNISLESEIKNILRDDKSISNSNDSSRS